MTNENRMWPESFAPLSTAGPGQTLCPLRATQLEPAPDGMPWQCTREFGHEPPCEAAGPNGTVYARWVSNWPETKPATGEVVTLPAASRPARIAALHAAGLFLADSPDLPMPEKVDMVSWVSAARLKAIADLHGGQIHERNGARWVDIPVTLETLHGIEIRYTAYEEK